MSRSSAITIASLSLCLSVSGAAAQGFTMESTREAQAAVLAGADSTDTRDPGLGLLSRRFVPAVDRLSLAYVVPAPSTGLGSRSGLGGGLVRTVRHLTPLERVVYGADKGAFASLAVGTVGSWVGLWDEETAWYMMGAGAAIGAVLGGTIGSEHVHVGIGVQSDER